VAAPVAFQLIRDDDPWHVLAAFEELGEARLGGRLMTAPLHEEIQPTVVLIHRPPHIMASPLNRGKTPHRDAMCQLVSDAGRRS